MNGQYFLRKKENNLVTIKKNFSIKNLTDLITTNYGQKANILKFSKNINLTLTIFRTK